MAKQMKGVLLVSYAISVKSSPGPYPRGRHAQVPRNAGVREASVRIWATQNMLRIEVEDRGTGCDSKSSQSGGAGLTGMRQRATIVEGRLTVESSPGAGTRIRADLPLG